MYESCVLWYNHTPLCRRMLPVLVLHSLFNKGTFTIICLQCIFSPSILGLAAVLQGHIAQRSTPPPTPTRNRLILCSTDTKLTYKSC